MEQTVLIKEKVCSTYNSFTLKADLLFRYEKGISLLVIANVQLISAIPLAYILNFIQSVKSSSFFV